MLGCGSEDGSESGAESGGSGGSSGGASVGGSGGAAAGGSSTVTAGGSAGSAAQGGSAGQSSGGAGGSGQGGSAGTEGGTPPVFEAGVWVDISPPKGNTLCVALDPSNPWTLYAGIEYSGVWKTTDGGTSWEQLGPDADVDLYDGKTNQLELPIALAIDPSDPQ
ncbi:MAG TPA: hypothetical protein VGP93_01100, partial [Polyangiaceae bacterium]|nr:hypothetical protein [Polyangiaceae bacterium]